MPIASNSSEVKSANGCIVVNVYGDKRPDGAPADLVWGTDDSRPLNNDQELREYIHSKKELFTNQGHECKIYLRGDQKALFKGSRGVIRAASTEGIIDMVFGVLPAKGS
jgi:biopolymer transport protein ExbD